MNTYHFRNSIKTYVEKIFGIVNEDYDYSKTNQLLSIPIKTFIKNIACYPNRVVRSDYIMLRKTLSNEEIIHMILHASTLKARVSLTYLSFIIYEITKDID